MTPRGWLGPTLLMSLSMTTLAACGGGADAPAKAPSQGQAHADEASEPRSIEEANEHIARARADLEPLTSTPGAEAMMIEPQEGASSRPQAAPPGGGPSGKRGVDDVCARPCRALASMRRAVEALCRMTGDGDERCTEAKRTLSESARRASSCRCEAP